MNRFVLWFVKITGLPLQHFYYKKKIYYESENSPRKIKGSALIVSNHTDVFDYPLIMYTFLSRNIYTLIAKETMEKSWLMDCFLKALGGIKVERKNYNFSFLLEMINKLKKGEVGLVFPESRIPLEHERNDFLPFKPSYVYLALESNSPIIPIYTNGIYGKLKKKNKSHAKIIVGDYIYPNELISDERSEKENIDYINNYVKNYIQKLKDKMESGQ